MSSSPVRARLLTLTSLLALAAGLPASSSTLAQMAPAANAAVSAAGPIYPGDARPDAPALAPRGQYSVGVRTISLVRKDVLDIARAATMTPAP